MPFLLIVAALVCAGLWLCAIAMVCLLVYGLVLHPRPRRTVYFRPTTARSVLCDPRL